MSDGEVNELIATLERSNLRRTAAVFKERFDALTAENERLTRELQSIKSIIFGGPMPDGFELTGIVEEVRQGVIAHDRAKRKAEADADDEAAARRVAEKELAAAQQRLAALAIDPAKREELGAKALELQQSAFAEISRNSWKHIDNEYAQEGWMRCGETLFAAGRLSRDTEVAELRRQLDEARKWESQYKRLYENCDASHEKTLKQLAEANKRLAELTKPADAIELRKVAWANYGAIYAQQKGEPLEPYESSTPERRARIDKAADAVAARGRGPLLQQIAELRDKLAAAERTAKAANDGREHAVRNQDRLAAELADTKQALADARGEFERVRAAVRNFDVLPCVNESTRWPDPPDMDRRWTDAICKCADMVKAGIYAVIDQPAPANPAASEPIGLCPKCGIQPLTKEGDDMIRLGEKDYLCGNCKRYLCRPIEPKGAASEPADSSHTPETAHASSSQSETAERRFVCPRCGSEDHHELESDPPVVVCGMGSSGGRSDGCNWRGSWAEVEAAKGEETKDNRRLGHRQIDDLRARAFCCASDVNDAISLLNDRDAILVELQVMKQQLAAANQARDAEKQRADDTQVRLEAFERSPDEKQKSIWELEEAVSEAEERANENARLLHEQRQRAEAAEGRESALQSKLNDLEASRTALKRDLEQAEAAAGVMKETIKRVCFVGPADGRVCSSCGSCFSPHSPQCEVGKALATDPGRAANELRAGKALAGKIRDALCSVEAIAHVERALADYDQALAQGEQCGEVR